jgi:hypothetical protein
MSAGEFLSLEEGKMGETLVERDGWLYVLYQYPVYEKPEMVNIYWPLKIRAQQFISNYGNEYIGRELAIRVWGRNKLRQFRNRRKYAKSLSLQHVDHYRLWLLSL